MYSNSKIAKAVRFAMLVGASTAISLPAFAAEEAETVERISVTGSKIKRIGAVSPTPVTVISRVELQDAGISNVNDFLAEMPSADVGLSPENSNNYIYANGLNTTDLRGLGDNRTLVLVNGRRFIPGQAGGNAVDLNNIATSFIERIEISTGGASAVYGADAVAGVVNIITRKSFDGIEIDIATTRPNEGGGEQEFASLTFGKEEKDSGFIVNIDYAEQEQMAMMDKAWYRNNPVQSRANPDDATGDDGIPAMIQHNNAEHYGLYDESSEFFLGGDHWTFDENGNMRLFNNNDARQEVGGLPGSSRSWYYEGPYGDGIEYGADEFFRTPLKRFTVNVAGHQDLNDDHQLTWDVTYSDSKAHGQSTPIFLRSSQLVIQRDNAFIKDDLAAAWDAENERRANLDEPLDPITSIGMRRLSDDFGPRKYIQERATARASIGLDGIINDDWSYSAYFQHGTMRQDTSWKGEVILDNLISAIDAVEYNGEIVCADRNDEGEVVGALADCAPVNFLGKNEVSPEAQGYISTVATAERGHDQTSWGLTVDGEVFELPAGPVQAAFSYDWRKERAFETPGTGIRTGIIFGNSGDSYKGEVKVKEYSAEVVVPVLADQYLADELTLEFAYRYMDYSSTGTDSAYKLGLTWQINDDFRIRAAKAQSVRAPNIEELYSPAGTQFATRAEACAADNIEKATDYKANLIKNCAAAGIPEGWTPTDEWYNAGSLEGDLGGNPELQNEVSDDITIGFVYSPSYLENFDITVDYWKFEIEDAIRFYDYENSMDNCYQSESLDNVFCDKFTRDPVTHEVNGYYETSLNAAVEKISGVDIESRYKLDTSFGTFDFKLVATYLENREINQTGNAVDNKTYTGETARPRWRARFTTAYQYNEDLRVALIGNYRHSVVDDRNDWTIEDSNYNDIPSYTTFDLTMNYNVIDDVEVRLGMQNLADRTPPRNPHVYDDGTYYDVIGRRITAGVNVKF
ncbi:TonB-dependent receptor plug domain-containing protein [Thalassomonas haliotis]|uniref:TonB-dependent receptor n=1 Tax=Thalassomonas haliotis TaxID=485448 RepID=A0ABY7VJT9_9GAMM|nr:TonB-dependent receptor [Thalassomonas haliotis]WDE13783.1 TonB-dependent receptor [Thalassomonas haliotis]